jgi:hypothetical protein
VLLVDIARRTRSTSRRAGATDDTKHICPLQLGVIDRLVRLYSNPGEIVFSPFTRRPSVNSSGSPAPRKAFTRPD